MIKTSSYNDEHLIMMKSKRTYFTYNYHQGNVNDELQFECGGGPGAMVEAESELSGLNPTQAFKFQRNEMSLPRSRTVTKR